MKQAISAYFKNILSQAGRQKGFSLIELVVVLGIIAILAGVTVISLAHFLPSYRLKNAARDLVVQMQKIRLAAVKDNTSWRINFNTAAGTYQVVGSGPDNTFGTGDDVTQPAVRLSDYGSGVTYGFGNAAQDWSGGALVQRGSVTFTNRGLCDMGATYLTNQDATVCYEVSTVIAGGIRLRQYNGVLPFNTSNWER